MSYGSIEWELVLRVGFTNNQSHALLRQTLYTTFIPTENLEVEVLQDDPYVYTVIGTRWLHYRDCFVVDVISSMPDNEDSIPTFIKQLGELIKTGVWELFDCTPDMAEVIVDNGIELTAEDDTGETTIEAPTEDNEEENEENDRDEFEGNRARVRLEQ